MQNTHKRIVDEILRWAESHLIINSHGYGLVPDEDGDKDIQYPKLFIVPDTSPMKKNEDVNVFRIECYGLINYDQSKIVDNDESKLELQGMQIQLMSDCKQILNDLYNDLRWSTDYFYFDRENPTVEISNLEPFIDFKSQRESGWILPIEISFSQANDSCKTPI